MAMYAWFIKRSVGNGYMARFTKNRKEYGTRKKISLYF